MARDLGIAPDTTTSDGIARIAEEYAKGYVENLRQAAFEGCLDALPSPTSAPGESTPTAKCEEVSSDVVRAIEVSLTADGGGSVSDAAAVRSEDFDEVWMVAAQIEAAGFEGQAGVWATNNLNGIGSIFAADGIAQEFSDFGEGPGFSAADDGVAEALECLG